MSVNTVRAYSFFCMMHTSCVKEGLHRNANAACENDAYVHVDKFVDCSAFAEAANWPYINVLYANSLWCTDSWRIAFGCSPNIRHTAECCLPRLRNTSTSNVRIVFACRVRILFAFRCKCGFTRECSVVSVVDSWCGYLVRVSPIKNLSKSLSNVFSLKDERLPPCRSALEQPL